MSDGAFDDELGYWRRFLAGGESSRPPGERRLDILLDPARRQLKFPAILTRLIGRHLPAAPPWKVVEVGPGPLSSLAWGVDVGLLEVVGIDPLADEYRALLDRHGFDYPIRPVTGTAETVDDLLPAAVFDIAYARNSLDHTTSPGRCLQAMANLLAPGGLLVLEGAVEEGTQQGWHGMHQHDLAPRAGELWLSGRDGEAADLTGPLGLELVYLGSGQVEPVECVSFARNDWYVMAFRKPSPPGHRPAPD